MQPSYVYIHDAQAINKKTHQEVGRLFHTCRELLLYVGYLWKLSVIKIIDRHSILCITSTGGDSPSIMRSHLIFYIASTVSHVVRVRHIN